MATRKFPREALLEIIDGVKSVPEHGMTLVEEGEWEGGGKWQSCRTIFEHEGKHYAVTNRRSGSYHSDYYYENEDWGDEVECDEVKRVEIVTYEWHTA